jgi:acetyltransferase-like isoleucine patch superfamily enzyme
MGLLLEVVRRVRLSVSVRRNVHYASDLRVGRATFIAAPTRLTIGPQVSIGAHCFIACNGSIGTGVLISSYVGLVGRYDHDMRAIGQCMTSAPWIYDQNISEHDPNHRIDIGDDVWIGYGATVLSRTKIGRGAVVGVRAVVTCDVPPYAIVVGTPARVVGSRFQEHEIGPHEAGISASNTR